MLRRLHLLLLLLASARALPAQILHLADLNTTQINALDRSRTVLLIPNGIIEEHGPYLPTFTDGFLDEAVALEAARTIVARPGWTVVLFPTIPLGTDPANSIGHLWTFPGSVTIRPDTMRAVFFDLADALGEQGFHHIFLIDTHGGPSNSRVLDQASDYFHDTWHGRMVHLLGLMPVIDSIKALEQTLTPAQLAENGLSVHADALELSLNLFLRPDLTQGTYTLAPSLPGASFPALIAAAGKPAWPGYLGAPKYATPALGALAFAQINDTLRRLIPDILDGKLDPSTLPRYGDVFSSLASDVETPFLQHQAEAAQRQAAWLATHPKPAPGHP